MLWILQLICCFFIVRYALKPERAWWARLLGIGGLILGFVVPFGWLLHLLWGGVCWADARSEQYG
jgi:hypothetical protein